MRLFTNRLSRAALLCIAVILSCSIARAGNDPAIVNRTYEITLLSSYQYSHPVRDVETACIFTHVQSGRVDTAFAFWDGERTYRVRTALPISGEWSWRTVCSDAGNTGLHGVEGKADAMPGSDTGAFDRHGWLRSSGDGRYLEHEDGTPFFWLGDTSWEIVWKSQREQVERYLDDRRSKGFSAIQIVVLSHQVLLPYGVRNRNGATAFLQEDFSRPNPDYFRYLDTLVELVNRHDMTAVLVPMWASYNELYRPQDLCCTFTHDESIGLARYVGSRYAGHNVTWIVGGDNLYETDARKSFWRQFGRTLKRYGGRRHLATVHPRGWESSFKFFGGAEDDWLDFHMYQSSHIAGGDYTWEAALEGYGRTPVKPVLNGEPTYEDIYNNLWAPGDTAHPNSFRIRPDQVRQTCYESILSGAIVGITYGANGVWQWHTEQQNGTHRPRFVVDDAWEMPGSHSMTYLKEILRSLAWYRLRPARDLLISDGTDEFVPVAAGNDLIVAYSPLGNFYVQLNVSSIPGPLCYTWINPNDGERSHCFRPAEGSDSTRVIFKAPDQGDWLLVVRRADATSVSEPEVISSNITASYSRASDRIEIAIENTPGREVSLEVHSITGEMIDRQTARIAGSEIFTIDAPKSGAYLYTMRVIRDGNCVDVHRGKLLVVK